MGQRSQVAGGAQRALLGDDGGDALVQHLDHHLDQERTHAGHAHAQSVGTQQQHAAGNLRHIGIAHGGAVADNQVGGQLVGHLGRNSDLLEVAETGGDAVSHALLGGDLLGQGAGLLHGLQSGVGQLDSGAVTGDSNEGLQVQVMTSQNDMLDFLRIIHFSNVSFLLCDYGLVDGTDAGKELHARPSGGREFWDFSRSTYLSPNQRNWEITMAPIIRATL